MSNAENTAKIQQVGQILDEDGNDMPKRVIGRPFPKGVSGNPAGKPPGVKNKFSPVAQLQKIWDENPELFDGFVRKWMNNPRNQQQIVEILDGKPQTSQTTVAIQNNISVGYTSLDDALPSIIEAIGDMSEEQKDRIRGVL